MILDTLVIDRAQSDVAYIKTLASKDWSEFTVEEKAYWLYGEQEALEATDGDLYETDGLLTVGNGVVKGSYNATDLNRVGQACTYLYNLITGMGYFVPGYSALKTDWSVSDVPTAAQMQTYITTIAALKALWSAAQIIPATMDSLGYEGANNIEKLLIEVDGQITRITAIFIRNGAWNAFSGTGIYIKN